MATGNIAADRTIPIVSFKHDFTDQFSAGIQYEQPFAADVTYGPSAIAFAGTTASADVSSITALMRYKLSERFSVHGGLRWQTAKANFGLSGALYGPFSGYTATMDRDSALGYVIGGAFEIPEYFLRVALTYNSEIEHEFTTTEVSGLTTLVTPVSASMPQSLNLEFQSGIAPATFVFGGARWVEWSKLQFAPPILSAATPDPLVNFEDTVTYTLGIGRQFSENWTGTAALIFEPATDFASTPLTPSDGFHGVALGVIYTQDNFELHANVVATRLGDAAPFVTAPLFTTVSNFTDNTSVAAGFKIVQRF
jgi:long-subunit fatty acid transport protein